jgi:integrase
LVACRERPSNHITFDNIGGAIMDRDLPARTSALKAKRIPLADLEKLETYLKFLARSSLARETVTWLRAGCLTGLRPSEWREAVLDGNWLIVKNAKTTNGRGNGVERSLDLSALSGGDLRVVERMAGLGGGWALQGEYDQRQTQCAAVLYAACLKIWPSPRRHYTLYSARHQALANAKATMTRAEVSALAGHKTERTAQSRYGRRTSAWNRSEMPGAASPAAENTATVKPWSNPYWSAEAKAARAARPAEISPTPSSPSPSPR